MAESGVRTHGTLLTYTRFPSVRLKPLGHLSVLRANSKCKMQNAKLSVALNSAFCILHFAFSRASASRNGGEGGIRTPDTREGITVFETAAFNHSATSPYGCGVSGRTAEECCATAALRLREPPRDGDS